MPTDRLNPRCRSPAHSSNALRPTSAELGAAVLAVLAGAPLARTASDLHLPAEELADAIDVYQQAGHVALETQVANKLWYQVHVTFPNWAEAEATVTSQLLPHIERLQEAGVLLGWWFIRKAPSWRFRFKPGIGTNLANATTSVNRTLDELTANGLATHWRTTTYEPETLAFGGPLGIDIAHDLFCIDSRNTLAYVQQSAPPIGPRELSLLLLTSLFRAAGQEWHECGDIWHRVTQMRPATAIQPQLAEDVRNLLTADTHPAGPLFGPDGTLAFAHPWASAYHQAGQALAAAAADGALQRGTRSILTHHVVFAWNRLGLPTATQANLAQAATTAILSAE